MRTRVITAAAIIVVLAGCSADPEPEQRVTEPVAEATQATPAPEPEETSEPVELPEATKAEPADPAPEPTQDQDEPAGPEDGDDDPPPASPSPEPTSADPGPQETNTTEPEPTADPEPTTPEPAYDAEWAEIYARYIVEDIITADERFLDHPRSGGGTTMMFLSGHMDDLLELGIPPGVNDSEYYALVATLGEFFDRARQELREGQVMEATATYATARQHTGDLLAILNTTLGTEHELPPNPFG